MPNQQTEAAFRGAHNSDLNILFDRLTGVTTWGCLAYIAAMLVVDEDAGRLLAPMVIAIGGPVCNLLRRRVDSALGFGAYLWSIFIAIAAQSVVRGGVINPVLHVSVVLVLIGGWLLGMRQAFWLLLASVIWAAVLTYAGVYRGWTPEPSGKGVGYWFALSAVWIIGYIAIRLVLGAHEKRLRDIVALQSDVQEKVAALAFQEKSASINAQRVIQILNASPLPITVADFHTGVYVDVNPAWERFFGYAKKNVLGKTSVDLGFWRDMNDRQGWIDRFNAAGRVSEYEVTFTLRDGTSRIFMLSSERFTYGEQDCVLTMSVDITERKVLEADLKALNTNLEQRVFERTGELNQANQELLQTMGTLQRAQEELIQSDKLASLGSLVAGVAHELNTPLGNAIMAASALNEDIDTMRVDIAAGTMRKSAFEGFFQRMTEGITLTLRSVQRAAVLVTSFKQVAVDQESERRRDFDLAQVIQEVVETMRPSLKRQNVELVLELEAGITMDGFPGPLGQVVMNLIVNAEKHAFEGRKQRSVTVKVLGDSIDTARIEVNDDGNGIPQNHLGQIFDPFFTTKLGQGGSGLGLSISHRIVTKVLGGQIGVRSVEGSGTYFHMTLPKVAPGVVR